LTFYDEKGLRKKVQFSRSPARETPSPDRLGPYFIAFWNHGYRFRFTNSKHARALAGALASSSPARALNLRFLVHHFL